MAASESVLIRAASNKVWGAVVKLVHAAGFPVLDANQGMKQIVYVAPGGWWAWKQRVKISINETDEGECLVSILVKPASFPTFTQGIAQRKIIQSLLDDLWKQFPESGALGVPNPSPSMQTESPKAAGLGDSGTSSRPKFPSPPMPGQVTVSAAKWLARKARDYAGSEEVKDAVGRARVAASAVGDRAMKAARGAMDDKSSPKSDATTTGQTTSTSIRDNLVVVALSMMCCGPLGLFFVWTNPRWSKFQKVAWSLLMLPMLMIGSCIQEQKVQEVVRSLVEGDRLWDAGSRDEAADRYRKAWKDHKEILTNSTDRTRELIRPHLPTLYARLMVYELSKGRRDEARQLSEQAIKDKIELTLETAEARDFHNTHMPNNSIADAPTQGRANGETFGGRGGQSNSTGDSSAKLNKGFFTDSWDYKNGCQVIFEKNVTSLEARKLGDYLRSREFFDNDPVTFQIGKPGKTYEFRVVIKKGLEQDQDTIDAMNQLGREISRSVFGGSPVDVHLCDDRMKTIRVIVP